MAHSAGFPYSLYSGVDVSKPFSSLNEPHYVSEPYYPPTPIISNMFHGSFPSYYVDDDDDVEDFLRKESKVGQEPKPDENKKEEVDNTNKMLNLFQVVMIIVLLLRLGVSLK
ncbi:hypothetical protein PVMG_04436 [Plasmodium vivax Mauritania I]|uniref:Uncharacterized protein n=1 Tax=Plasmodium vivax Mauritania I TaxID=1035515 RepID=A0A0J9TB66_PLAVI|nr:hypothetical protein PVMG_04436 [Plasmodium vivax Mauritania I]